MKKHPFLFIWLLFAVMIISCKRESVSELNKAEVNQRIQVLKDYDFLTHTYRANVEFDTISPSYTSEFQNILAIQDTVILSNYRVVDIEKFDNHFEVSIAKRGNSSLFGTILCDEKHLARIQEGAKRSGIQNTGKNTYLLLKVTAIGKIKFEYRINPSMESSYFDSKTVVASRKQFLFKGKLIECIQI